MIKRIFNTITSKPSAKSGLILMGAMLTANIVNLVFNMLMGRILTYQEYALVTLINTVYNLVLLTLSALNTTVNHQVAALAAKQKLGTIREYMRTIEKTAITSIAVLSIIALVGLPYISIFFRNADMIALGLIISTLACVTYNIISTGYLYGTLSFHSVAYLLITEVIVKLSVGILLAFSPFRAYVYLAIPISILSQWIIAIIIRKGKAPNDQSSKAQKEQFAKGFFLTALMTGMATSAFLQVDVLTAAHYLTTEETGKYAILSLGGKMIYFFGSMINTFTITLISRNISLGKSTFKLLLATITMMALVTGAGYSVVGLFANLTMPLLFGNNGQSVAHIMPTYAAAMALYTFSTVITTYHLARRSYIIPAVGITTIVVFLIKASFTHNSIEDIASDMLIAAVYHTSAVLALHFIIARGRYVLTNILDLVDLFTTQSPENANKKSILLLNWRDTKHIYAGGAEVYVHELAKRWVQMGMQVTQFCGNDGRAPRSETVDGVHIIRRGGLYTVYLWSALYYIFRFRKHVDVIVESQNGAPFLSPLYSRKKIVPIIHHINQHLFDKSLPKPLAIIAKNVEKWLIPFLYRNYEFTVISPSTRKELKKLSNWPLNTTIIYCGIDNQLYIPGKKSHVPTVLYVGRLKKHKQVNILLEAARLVRKEMPAFKLIIAGDGDEKQSLEMLAEKLALKANVEFKGKVTEEEKIKLYQEAWVCVQPSMTEGWGITNIEANACGTPVIASNIPGLRDSVKHNETGILFETGNITELATHIHELLTNTTKREQLASNAIQWAQKFSWDASAKKAATKIKTSEPKKPIISTVITAPRFEFLRGLL